MGVYTFRRVILSIPVLLGILVVTFMIARLIPGDPCHSILGERATPAQCEAFDKRMGLDKPIPIQLGIYLNDVIHGDFGDSIRFKRPVSLLLVEKLPVTIELGAIALFLATLIGVPLGMISALKRNTKVDVATMVGANIGVSMPVYWLGLMLQYLFAIQLRDTFLWLPPSGRLTAGLKSIPFYEVWGWAAEPETIRDTLFTFFSKMYLFNSLITWDIEIFKDVMTHMFLPAVALSTIPMAIIARITRSSMLEVLGQDYIRTAKAKGVREFSLITKHAFRNAMLPIVTIVGLQAGTLFAGAVLTETIFSLAGVGRSLFDAITGRDFPVIQGFTVVIAILYVLVNLIVDISYAFIDPRIKLE